MLTEWNEFKTYPYHVFYDTFMKPALLFDGRRILDHTVLKNIGFEVHAIGKEEHPTEGCEHSRMQLGVTLPQPSMHLFLERCEHFFGLLK